MATTYYSEGFFGVVSFETDPHHDINADAKFWSPDTESWVDCPGSTGIGADVLYSVDFYPIPADAVEEMQTRCRDLMARRAAPGSTSGYTPRPRPSRRGDGTLPIRASEPLAREETVPMTTYCKEAPGIVSFRDRRAD